MKDCAPWSWELVDNREGTLGTFLDIEGASDSTSHSFIIEAAKRHGLEDTICLWINFVLGNRKITATLAAETLEGSVARDCPQGGICCPGCGVWLWTNSLEESLRMAITRWGTLMTLLS
jgi:hypothetical protein